MENKTLFIVGGVCLVAVLITIGLAYLKHKGVNLKSFFKEAETGLKGAETCTNAMIALSTGKLKTFLIPVKKLEDLALIGVCAVQDKFLNGEITNDASGEQRRQAAMDFVFGILKTMNIEITDNIKAIVESLVRKEYLSNKTIDELNKKVDDLITKQVADIQKEKENLQAQLNVTTNENTTLKTNIISLQNKLATVQNALNTNTQNAVSQPVEQNSQQ